MVESVGASGKKCGGSILATVEGQIPHHLGVAKEHALDCRRFGGHFVRLPQPWLFGVTPFRCRDRSEGRGSLFARAAGPGSAVRIL